MYCPCLLTEGTEASITILTLRSVPASSSTRVVVVVVVVVVAAG